MSSEIKEILEWTYCILIAIIIALLIRYYIGTPTIVKQVSMYDTLEEGQRLWLNRWVRTTSKDYKRGEIITFEAPSDPIVAIADVDINNPVAKYNNSPKGIFGKFVYYVLELNKMSYIKRVIGVAGDHIKIEDGKVYLNGEELQEDYLNENIETKGGNYLDIVVPEGYVYVLGDNREHSTDSRMFGCIPINKIESRVAFRFWPLSKFGKVD